MNNIFIFFILLIILVIIIKELIYHLSTSEYMSNINYPIVYHESEESNSLDLDTNSEIITVIFFNAFFYF